MPSLCDGWSVHDVAAHLISNATTRGRDITFGAGPEARGRAVDLLLTLAGRTIAAGDLRGPGAQLLADRT